MDSIFPPVSFSVQLCVLCVSVVILHFPFYNAFNGDINLTMSSSLVGWVRLAESRLLAKNSFSIPDYLWIAKFLNPTPDYSATIQTVIQGESCSVSKSYKESVFTFTIWRRGGIVSRGLIILKAGKGEGNIELSFSLFSLCSPCLCGEIFTVLWL